MSATPPASGETSGVLRRVERSRLLTGKTLAALLVVLFLVAAVATVWVSALQAQVPRNMPFGVTGRSLVVRLAQAKKISGYKTSFDNTTYPNETAAMNAINQGTIYGAYITGPSSDTLLISQAKSFFAYTEIRPLFSAAAKLLRRLLNVTEGRQAVAGGQGPDRSDERHAAWKEKSPSRYRFRRLALAESEWSSLAAGQLHYRSVGGGEA